MTPTSILLSGTTALALLGLATVSPAQFAPAPTPTADALAAQMRQLGSNPRDVYALIAAGELSTKLGDPTAALAFFARATAVEPANPRIAAGRAGALVLLERPGEALQLYAGAERAGVAMTPYLAQRGLAYDLVGQPGYAQRDYRRALEGGQDDETVRRLALSLGISGRRDEAMTLLDPLLRRSDRAAWRARACILAVAGDVAGAQQIAASMMNGGAALSPFFSRLQWLSPIDRAFAVHFGEVAGSPARVADARLAPTLAALPVTPQALPSTAPVVASDVRTPDRREARRRRPGREPITVAAAIPRPAPILPGPPTQVAAATAVLAPVGNGSALPLRQPTPATVSMAGTATARVSAPPAATAPATGTWAVTADAPRVTPAPQRTDTPVVEIVTLPPRRAVQVAAAPPPPPHQVSTPAPAPTPTPSPVQLPSPVLATPVEATPAATPEPVETVPVVTPAPVVAAPPPAPPPPPPPPPFAERRTPEVAHRNTQLLASIIDTIAVPASELDVAPARTPARPAAVPKPERVADTLKAEPKKAELKKLEAKKPEPKKPEPKKPDPAKTDPARWWVQVAGGANAADLGKDWKRLTAKSPATFRGRGAYTTPLRATNRLLTGPFKTQAEAMAFVNALKKDGASAFAFQSDAGQKVDRLGGK